MPDPSTSAIPCLRAQLESLSLRSRRLLGHRRFATGLDVIDGLLPGNGLAAGALHEFVGMRPAVLGWIGALVSRDRRTTDLLWIGASADLYRPGFVQLGLRHQRVTFVGAPKTEDRLWAFEEALRDLKHGAVVAEINEADLTETRRLQLAAEQGGGTGFLVREKTGPSAAQTRWRIEPWPSDGYRPCWRLSLERGRNGRIGAWAVEWDHATLSFRLVAALADGSLAAAE